MNTTVSVEDSPEVGPPIAAYLARHDVEVILEPRGDLAEEKTLHVQPDLVLLGITLSDKSGVTIYHDLRGRWQGLIVLLASLDSDMNRIFALEMGTCDYILKAALPAALLARPRLRLCQNEHPAQSKDVQVVTTTLHTTPRFGTFTTDPTDHSVLLDGRQVSLSTADFELLWELATHAGQTTDRNALLENLRGVSYDDMDRSTDVVISRLHGKLLDNAVESYRIKTIHNKGYPFTPHAWDDELQKQCHRADLIGRLDYSQCVTPSRVITYRASI